MPNGDAARAAFVAGLSEGLSWPNVGKSLATGVVSGIGAWAVGILLDQLFANNGRTIEDMLEDFRAQIVAVMARVMRIELDAVFDRELFRTVKNRTKATAENFRTKAAVRDFNGLRQCWMDATGARTSAESLDLLGFPMFYTVLDLQVAISEEIRNLPPVDPNMDRDLWQRTWREASLTPITEGDRYLQNTATRLYGINNNRVAVRPVGQAFPSTEPETDIFRIIVDGQPGRTFRVESAEDIERERQRAVTSLNRVTDQDILNPAREIMNELGKLRFIVITGFIPGSLGTDVLTNR